jgi:hypothetical protein
LLHYLLLLLLLLLLRCGSSGALRACIPPYPASCTFPSTSSICYRLAAAAAVRTGWVLFQLLC